MSRLNSAVRQFLDIEAGVDNTEEEEEEEAEHLERDLEESFIDDESDPAGEVDRASAQYSLAMRPGINADDDELDEFWGGLLRRACESSTRSRDPYGDDLLIRQPSDDDYPLWMVHCRIGTEENVILHLLHSADEKHCLRAAFSRGTIRGSVYLECQMNENLLRLLRSTPGIISNRSGVKRRLIDREDALRLLKMKSVDVGVSWGDFVRIKKGLYEGDVGCVVKVHSWGVDVLLAPRLAYKRSGNPAKRKATTPRPEPQLFDPESHLVEGLKQITEHSFTLGRLLLQHGLISKSFDYHSFSLPLTEIPLMFFKFFVASRHPEISRISLPRPVEWLFEIDDWIRITTRKEDATIKHITTVGAEVEISSGEIVLISWKHVLKKFDIGDAVSVHGGEHSGYKGWVVETHDEIAIVINKSVEGDILQDRYADAMKPIHVHVNCLIFNDPEFRHSRQRGYQPRTLGMLEHHPWHGVSVVVSRKHHPLKGKEGRISSVLYSQATTSGMRLEIQISHYDPAVPFRKVTVDYDDVVESSTHLKLIDFKSLKGDDLKKIGVETLPDNVVQGIGGATPLPTEPLGSSTPAWDPSSMTPLVMNHSPVWSPSSNSLEPATSQPPSESPQAQSSSISLSSPSHILLNPILLDYKVLVTIEGGPEKKRDTSVSICMTEGRMNMRSSKHGVSKLIEPQYVKPNHPSATHDNGLLVVIEGDHCGKYVRRIYHKNKSDASKAMILAVVQRTQGVMDTLTGEQLELDVGSLCKVEETKTEKDLNKNVTTDLRKIYLRNAKK